MKFWLSTLLVLVAFITGTMPSGLAKQKNTTRDSRLPGETLTVGSTQLGIGMGKDKIVSLLAQDGFQIVPSGNTPAASNAERLESLRFFKPKSAVYTMFEDGKLIQASKSFDFQTSDE